MKDLRMSSSSKSKAKFGKITDFQTPKMQVVQSEAVLGEHPPFTIVEEEGNKLCR